MLFALSDEIILAIIGAIPVMAAAIVSIIVALKTGKKVDALDTKVSQAVDAPIDYVRAGNGIMVPVYDQKIADKLADK